MYISISHGVLSNGTKISFNRYRGLIASIIGITEKEEDLYNPWLDPTDWKTISQYTDYFGYWKEAPKDPIWYLLALSDTYGVIKPEYGLLLANRLTEILPLFPEKSDSIKITKLFIKGLKAAAKKNEELTITPII